MTWILGIIATVLGVSGQPATPAHQSAPVVIQAPAPVESITDTMPTPGPSAADVDQSRLTLPTPGPTPFVQPPPFAPGGYNPATVVTVNNPNCPTSDVTGQAINGGGVVVACAVNP